MKYFLTLIFITNIGYSAYLYPELYRMAGEIAWEKVKSEVLSPLKDKAGDCFNGLVAELKNGCTERYNGLVADCKNGCNDLLASLDGDTVQCVKEKVLPGDIYDINYVICYQGHCMYAHSRSLGKPHVNGNSIHYTLPTGQQYHFAMPEGEGTIMLKSAELIKL